MKLRKVPVETNPKNTCGRKRRTRRKTGGARKMNPARRRRRATRQPSTRERRHFVIMLLRSTSSDAMQYYFWNGKRAVWRKAEAKRYVREKLANAEAHNLARHHKKALRGFSHALVVPA